MPNTEESSFQRLLISVFSCFLRRDTRTLSSRRVFLIASGTVPRPLTPLLCDQNARLTARVTTSCVGIQWCILFKRLTAANQLPRVLGVPGN